MAESIEAKTNVEKLTQPGLGLHDACYLLVGIAMGFAFGEQIHNLAAGIGTGLVMGASSNMSRRAGNANPMLWLGIYSVLLLVTSTLKLTGSLK